MNVEERWLAQDGSGPFGYLYVLAVHPGSEQRNHVLFGGGSQGSGPARLLRSEQGGTAPTEVILEGVPNGAVRALAVSPEPDQLLIAVSSGASLLLFTLRIG